MKDHQSVERADVAKQRLSNAELDVLLSDLRDGELAYSNHGLLRQARVAIEYLRERELDLLSKNALLGEAMPGEYEAGRQSVEQRVKALADRWERDPALTAGGKTLVFCASELRRVLAGKTDG